MKLPSLICITSVFYTTYLLKNVVYGESCQNYNSKLLWFILSMHLFKFQGKKKKKKKKKTQFTSLGLSVLGETVPSVLSTALSCIIQDLGHSFSQYRPPTWQITYIYCINCCVVQKCPTLRTAITAHL